MNKGPIALTVSLLLSVMLVLPPIAISAGRGPGGMGGGRGGAMGHAGFGGHGGFGVHVRGPVGSGGGHPSHRGFRQPLFHGRPFFNHHFNHHFGRFSPFGAFAYPLAAYGWPGYGWPYFYGTALDSSYDSAPAAYSPPVAYAQTPAPSVPMVYSINVYNPPPAAQPMIQPAIYEPPAAPMGAAAPSRPQDVVEYDGGRYELRGDGITVLYRWVWIPNPPPGPPGSSAMRAPAAAELAPARRGTIYRWVDDEGVLHVTDRWQTVPQRYREQAKQNLAS